MTAHVQKTTVPGKWISRIVLVTIVMAQGFLLAGPSNADEGMWLFNNLPKTLLDKYDFTIDKPWADKLMRASVRFNSGGSASFVSSNGLVLTNHHVGSDAIQDLSEKYDYLTHGFLAKTMDDELQAPDLELNQLVSILDVTDKVNAGVDDQNTPSEAAAARRRTIAQIEKEASNGSDNRFNVITLYGGGRYHLYEYKRFTDVRLVWAPESDAAFFGGDADNFEYPRYCLDACIFRVYEDGKPAKTEHFLKWNNSCPDKGDLVFVSGNPGSTSRIYTTAALKYERDVRMPDVLNFIRRREILLQQYSLDGPDSKRHANDETLGFQNSRKAYTGMLAGLQDPAFMQRRIDEEQALLAEIAKNPDLAPYAGAWQRIAETQGKRAKLRRESFSLNTRVYNLARSFVRLAVEDQKENQERLPEFRETARKSLQQQLLSTAPIYLDLERTKLADLIARTVEIRGADSDLCRVLLRGKCPLGRAEELIAGTSIHDPAFRKQLYSGERSSILSSKDPLIQLAILLDDEERRIRAANEELDEVERQAYSQIAEVMFAIKGTSVYPDATFTLRLAYGVVGGYVEHGKKIPAFTTMGGAFQHEKNHEGLDPWKLPKSWHNARDQIMSNTPFNFVCTADIIGGNSGSPVVNKELELVGLIFDGNIQSLTSDFFYSEKQARAISVTSSAIDEALRNIYGAEHIAEQLGK